MQEQEGKMNSAYTFQVHLIKPKTCFVRIEIQPETNQNEIFVRDEGTLVVGLHLIKQVDFFSLADPNTPIHTITDEDIAQHSLSIAQEDNRARAQAVFNMLGAHIRSIHQHKVPIIIDLPVPGNLPHSFKVVVKLQSSSACFRMNNPGDQFNIHITFSMDTWTKKETRDFFSKINEDELVERITQSLK
jgi:hypothetical protein